MEPAATPQGSPETSRPKSSDTKRPRKAVALSDVTNLLPDTPTPVKPRRTGRRTPPKPSDASSSALVTPAPKRSSVAVLQEERGVIKSPTISTVYARRVAAQALGRGNRGAPTTNKGKGKESAAAGTASCPQLGKATRNNNNRKRPSSSTIKLPEDFINKQRAYFTDVDAFELPEEEVSETDLD